MWNGNEDEEGLKEGFEKGEVIEDIRREGREGDELEDSIW